MSACRAPLTVALLALPAAALAADPPAFPGESAALARRFTDLEAKVEAAQWAEVVNELQAILGSAGDELVPTGAGHVLQARRLAHLRLSRLPPAALRLYRDHVEPRAKKAVEEARASRDAPALRRVVEESFCSESAAVALLLLGDLAFERGDFEEARGWWRLLAPLPGPGADSALTLRHPDGKKFEADAQARQLLARRFAGEPGWSAPAGLPADRSAAVEDFRRRHPDAKGYLAGEKGVLWKRLQAVGDEALAPRAGDDDWPTFAGSPARQPALPPGVLTPRRVARLLRDGTRLRIDLAPGDEDKPPAEVQPPAEAARSLAFCPIIVGKFVIYSDALRVSALDLDTGKTQVWLDAGKQLGLKGDSRLPAPADRRYTLTADEDCVLARPGTKSDSLLVCLELTPAEGRDRLRRSLPASSPGSEAVFEGTPVAAEGRAYVAVTELDGRKVRTAVHCYSPASRGKPGLVWKRDVCATDELSGGTRRARDHLLTLSGPHLFYCDHAGSVVALDTASGRVVWGVRYRQVRTGVNDGRPPTPRDLNPCVLAGGLLYVAPADSDLLLCLDPVTGRRIWERERITVTHLLGVSCGRLVFTTGTPDAGLRAVNAADGTDRGGWFQPAGGGSLPSFGRGLIAGDLVWWPTPKGVTVLRAEDGEPADDPTLLHDLPPGNLAYGGGVLVVADRTRLHVFRPRAAAPQGAADK